MQDKLFAQPPPTAAASGLCLTLFGAFDLRRKGQSLPPTRTRKEQWLLTLLVLRPNIPVDRSQLAGTLWPDSDEKQALGNLRRSLNNLRHVLGEDARRITAPTPRTIAFDLADDSCDLIAFDAAIKKGDEESLQSAVSLYGGPLLQACDENWIAPERAVRAERFLTALETLAELREQRGDLPEALRLWQRVIAADSLREAAYRRMMEIYGRLGDQTGVERQYRELRRHFWNELHVEPMAETTALYCRLRAQAQAAPAERQEEHRTTMPAVPVHSLPCPLTSLVGRVEEQQDVHAALQTARMVTLVGPGGVGKTRLALSVGELERQSYPDGVRFADLTPAKVDTDVPQTVFAALSLSSNADTPPTEAICRFFQPRHLLLILDNAEHIAEAAAQLAAELLRHCPRLTILSASRQPLYVPGESVFLVSPLAVPDEATPRTDVTEYAVNLAQCESVALLLDRVRSAAPAFRLTPRNAAAVASICRQLDGLPLALELAAARFRSLSAPQIAARLDTKFRLLKSGDPALPRHRTLYAALDWSYDLLSEAERRLLRHLSIFRGGWTLEAAEAICPVEEEETATLLTSLVDKSLVVYEVQEDQGRYRLLEMTRQYAAERLDVQENTALQARLAEFYYGMAQQADVNRPPIGVVEWLYALQRERDNFRTAYDWYDVRDSEAALWLEFFLYEMGVWIPQNRREWIARLQRDPMPASMLGMNVTLQTACWALWFSDPASEALFFQVIAAAELCSSPMWKVKALDVLGIMETERGNHRQALRYIEGALSIFPKNGDPFYSSTLTAKVARERAKIGEAAQAKNQLSELLEKGRREGIWHSIYNALYGLGEIAMQQQEYEEARACWQECIPYAEKYFPASLPNIWREQGKAACAQKDYGEAWHCLENALAISRQFNLLDREGWTRWDMAELAFQQGNRAEAQAQLGECLTIFQVHDEPHSQVLCLVKMAGFCAAWGQPERAATLLGSVERALEEYRFTARVKERESIDELASHIKQTIGNEVWQAAWEHGKQLSLSQAAHSVRDFHSP